MTDQLISFETAKLAKEKGLDTQLDNGGNCMVYHLDQPTKKPSSYHVHFTYPSREEYLYAPTQSLLQKWLREKHNIQMKVIFTISDTYYCHINNPMWRTGTKQKYISTESFKTYEEALEQGLIQALKLIP